MRYLRVVGITTLVILIALVGCDKGKPEASKQAVGSAQPIDAASVDAVVVDAWVMDAAAAAIDPDKILETEAIGGLKLRMDEAAVTAVLGPPTKKTKPFEEGATGEWVSDWTWPGVRLKMGAEKKAGPFVISAIEISAPSTLATSAGIKIGSTRADIAKVYPRSDEEVQKPKTEYLVGSVYGGMLFTLDHDKVKNIFLGAMAF